MLNISQEVLATTIRHEKEIKGIQITKKTKPTIFEDDLIIYIEKP